MRSRRLIPRSGPRVYLAAWAQRRGLDVNNCSDVGVGPVVSLLQLVPTGKSCCNDLDSTMVICKRVPERRSSLAWRE